MKRVWKKTGKKKTFSLTAGANQGLDLGHVSAVKLEAACSDRRFASLDSKKTPGHSIFSMADSAARGDELTVQRWRLLQGTKATSAGSGAS